MSDVTLDDLQTEASKAVFSMLMEEEFVDIPEIIETASRTVWDALYPELTEMKDTQTWGSECLNCSSLLETNYTQDETIEKFKVAIFELEKGMIDIYQATLDEAPEYATIVDAILKKAVARAKSPDVRDIHWKTRVK